jgi:hypothetical protein
VRSTTRADGGSGCADARRFSHRTTPPRDDGPIEFFFPNAEGTGHAKPGHAETLWQACRKSSEHDTGREALARRVYRLSYTHDGEDVTATVGEPWAANGELVMAIIAFPEMYAIRCLFRGFLQSGDPISVGRHDVIRVEDFDELASLEPPQHTS